MSNGSSRKEENPINRLGRFVKAKVSRGPKAALSTGKREALKRKIDASSARERLEDDVGEIYRKERYYALGSARLGGKVEHEKEIEKVTLVGSVDSTRFLQKWHSPSWYKPYISATSAVSSCYKLLDKPTQKWFDRLKPALEVFEKLGTYDARKFKKEYKRDIWGLVKERGSNIVYGAKGILNFLLAFRRIVAFYPDFDINKLDITEIKLTVGSGKGRRGGKKSRYARIVARKMRVKPKPKPKPQPQTKPVPKPKQEPASETEKSPKFDTSAFYKYYEIEDTVKFKEDIGVLNLWLTEEKLDFLKDKNFWEPKPGESPDERGTRLSNLFERGYGEISKPFVRLEEFRESYPEFFSDANNSDSVKYQEFYFLVAKRNIEYVERSIPAGMDRDSVLAQFHEKMLDGAVNLRLVERHKKPVLQQLVVSAEYMKENYPIEPEKWKKLFGQYKKELEELGK